MGTAEADLGAGRELDCEGVRENSKYEVRIVCAMILHCHDNCRRYSACMESCVEARAFFHSVMVLNLVGRLLNFKDCLEWIAALQIKSDRS